MESANAVAISRQGTPPAHPMTVRIFTFNPSIVEKQSLQMTENTNFLGDRNFRSMSEIAATKRLLVLSNKGIVDIWDISNLDNVTNQVYYLDGGDPTLKGYNYIHAFKDSTQFFVALIDSSLMSIQRFDYSLPTPGVISVPREFENTNSGGTEF